MEGLPISLLGMVLGYLKPRDACSARGVCRAWRNGRAMWNKLTLYCITDVTFAASTFTFLPGCLQRLDLSFSMITDASLVYIAAYSSLRWLNLHGCKEITDAGLARVAALVNLEHLNVSCCEQITDIGLMHISVLSNLQMVSLAGCQVTDAGLTHLMQISNLRRLNVRFCVRLTGVGFVLLAARLNLKVDL